MRAAVLTRFGGADSFETRDVPIPDIRSHEALIRVAAAGLCGRDVMVRRGELPGVTLPKILGHEVSGIVEAVGDLVVGIKPGDRVATRQKTSCHVCRYCRTGSETLCRESRQIGDEIPGGYAEYVALDYLSLVKVPEAVDMRHAAIAACAIGTNLHALRLARFQAGERVLVTGAGGGLGIHALQVARVSGAEVVAITSSESKAVVLQEFADHVVISKNNAFHEEVRSRRLSPDVILEMTAGVTLGESLRSVERGGRVVVVGNINLGDAPVSTGALIMREMKLIGASSTTREELEDTMNFISRGVIRPVVGAAFPLSEVSQAHRVADDRQTAGRIVIDCSGAST